MKLNTSTYPSQSTFLRLKLSFVKSHFSRRDNWLEIISDAATIRWNNEINAIFHGMTSEILSSSRGRACIPCASTNGRVQLQAGHFEHETHRWYVVYGEPYDMLDKITTGEETKDTCNVTRKRNRKNGRIPRANEAK